MPCRRTLRIPQREFRLGQNRVRAESDILALEVEAILADELEAASRFWRIRPVSGSEVVDDLLRVFGGFPIPDDPELLAAEEPALAESKNNILPDIGARFAKQAAERPDETGGVLSNCPLEIPFAPDPALVQVTGSKRREDRNRRRIPVRAKSVPMGQIALKVCGRDRK